MYFDALLLGADVFRIVMSSWELDPFIIKQCTCILLIIFYIWKSALPEINTIQLKKIKIQLSFQVLSREVVSDALALPLPVWGMSWGKDDQDISILYLLPLELSFYPIRGGEWVEGLPWLLSWTNKQFKLFILELEGMRNAGGLPLPVRYGNPRLGTEQGGSILFLFTPT